MAHGRGAYVCSGCLSRDFSCSPLPTDGMEKSEGRTASRILFDHAAHVFGGIDTQQPWDHQDHLALLRD